MSGLMDALLAQPIAEVVAKFMLFVLFALHFLFVLFTIGTAIQSVFYFIRYRWGHGSSRPDDDQSAQTALPEQDDAPAIHLPAQQDAHGMPTAIPLPTAAVAPQEKEFAWGKQILHSFLGLKSLAVVFGVGALLLIELSLTVPFFTAINLLAPYWLMIILFLIIAFLTLDLIGQNWDVRVVWHLGLGLTGLVFLLAVPGIFVAVMITAEQPQYWPAIMNNAYRLPWTLSLHWLFRYAHVIGAAMVFGGAFHYFYSHADQRQKRAEMLRWIVAGILLQFALGVLLYASLPRQPDWLMNWLIVAAIAAASVLLWQTAFYQELPLRMAVPLLMLVLLPMLLVRQALQDQGMMPVIAQAQKNSQAYRSALAEYIPQGLAAYQSDLDLRYTDGQAIYMRSCAFCHGEQADGNGMEAGKLQIPPEVLAAVRSEQSYLEPILRTGVIGTGMPYFSFLTRDQMDALLGYLDEQHQMLQPPAALEYQPTAQALQSAQSVYYSTCATCHGGDGRGGTTFSIGFAPPPPDFTRYSLTPQRSYDVITHGYPGTLMVPFGNLPEDVRWGLVQVVQGLRKLPVP